MVGDCHAVQRKLWFRGLHTGYSLIYAALGAMICRLRGPRNLPAPIVIVGRVYRKRLGLDAMSSGLRENFDRPRTVTFPSARDDAECASAASTGPTASYGCSSGVARGANVREKEVSTLTQHGSSFTRN